MILKVSTDAPPTGISEGAKLLAIAGGSPTPPPPPPPTTSEALALSPVPPLVELTAEVVLTLMPAVVPVTLIHHYLRKYQVAYLADQVYLSPTPKELMLRNYV